MYIKMFLVSECNICLSTLHLSFNQCTHLMYIIIIRDNDIQCSQQLNFRIRFLYSYFKVQSEQTTYSFNVLKYEYTLIFKCVMTLKSELDPHKKNVRITNISNTIVLHLGNIWSELDPHKKNVRITNISKTIVLHLGNILLPLSKKNSLINTFIHV